MAADGSVVFEIDAKVSDAEKKLAKLGNKVKSLEKAISEGQKKEASATKEAERAYKSLEKAQAKLAQAQEKRDSLTDQQEPLIQQLIEVKTKITEAKAAFKEYGEQWRSGIIGADQKQERARETLKTLQMQYNEILEKIAKMDPAILRANAEVESQEEIVQQLNKAYSDAEQKTSAIRAENEVLEKELSETETEAGKLVQHIDGLKEDRLQKIADSAKIANQHIVDLNRELAELQARQKELESAKIGLGHEEYDRNTARIEEITRELKEYKKVLSEGGKSTAKQQPGVQTGERTIQSALGNLAAQFSKPIALAKTFGSIIGGIASKLLGIGTAAKKFGTAAAKAFSKAAMGIAKLLNKVNILPKIFNSIRSSLDHLGRIVKSALIFSVLYKGLSLVRGQMSAYLSVNAEFSTALRQLKGVLLTAFQPIYDIVVPAVTTLMNVLSRAIAVVSQFMAVLFGTTAKQAQSNAKDLYEQANALEATGSAAEDAAGSLASFDEINTINTQSSGGGGGGTAVETGPLFDWEYEETPFESWGEAFSAFLDKLLGGIPALETAFGNFASWLNDFTKKLYDMFTFPGVLEKVEQLGRDLASAFNGLVNQINWYQLGQALGAGLNLALQFLTEFVYTFDWINLGRSLAEMVNGLASEVDWYDFGRLLWTGFKIGLETLAGFLLGLDMSLMAQAASNIVMGFFNSMTESIGKIEWAQIGLQIATFLNNIDWVGALSSIAEAIAAGLNAAITTLGTLVATLEWGKIGTAIAQAVNKLFADIDWEAAGKAFSDFLNGAIELGIKFLEETDWNAIGKDIVTFFENIDWKTLFSNLGQLVGDAIVAALELFTSDPVGLIKIGLDIVAGILRGIVNALLTIGTWLKENLVDPIVNWVKELLGIHSPSTVFAEIGTMLIEGLLQGISGTWSTIVEFFGEKLDALKQTLSEAWDSIKETAGKAWSSIKESLGEKWENIKTSATESWESLKTTIGNGWENIKGNTSEKWETIKTTLGTVWGAIKESASAKFEEIGSAISKVWETLETTTSTVWDGIWNGIKNVINFILGGVESMANGVINALNKMISALNSLHFDIPDWVPGIGGNSFGLNIPSIPTVSIPRLAQGAVIPANREFMAVLGDQSHGNNLEAPESLIRQIVREESGGGGETAALLQAILEAIKAGHVIMVDRRVLGQTVTKEQNRMTRQSGKSVVLG